MTDDSTHATNPLEKLRAVYGKHRKLTIGLACTVVSGLIIVIANYLWIGHYAQYIKQPNDVPGNGQLVGVVLGGGVDNGKPRPLLQDRLDTAAKLLHDKKVRKLLLSGDNRYAAYNEPKVMEDYLVHVKGVKPSQIALDEAGRSTYETCERAKKIFSLDEAVFISESTHLPRVMYLCRSFGIEAYGVSSDGQSSAGLKVGQRWREILARTKATINLRIIGEKTVLGDKIEL